MVSRVVLFSSMLDKCLTLTLCLPAFFPLRFLLCAYLTSSIGFFLSLVSFLFCPFFFFFFFLSVSTLLWPTSATTFHRAVDCLLPNCSGQGVCLHGHCRCFNGFKGSDCSLPDKINVTLVCAKNCSGHGVFDVDAGSCLCERHFSGLDCETGNQRVGTAGVKTLIQPLGLCNELTQ